MQVKNRIQILDGLRVLAIFMVMLFHFYGKYQGVYYQYSFDPPHIFMYGNLGVQLFFIISGFVITLTLTKSQTFIEFMKKRMLRLIPGMMICATLTYLVFTLFDTNNFHPPSKNISNLLLSYTFISPAFMKALFDVDFKYIDGAYWSLWVELQFYVLAGLTYFFSPKNFLRNYSIVSLIGLAAHMIFMVGEEASVAGLVGKNIYTHIHNGLDIFQLFKNNLWFLSGVVIYKMYYGKKNLSHLTFLLSIFAIQLGLLEDNYARVIGIGIMSLFLLFLYNQKVIGFLANNVLSKIGVASYSIYLIHQFVGFLMINRLSPYFGSLNWIIAIISIVIFTVFGLLSYKYLEKPLGDQLRKLFFGSQKRQMPAEPAVSTLP